MTMIKHVEYLFRKSVPIAALLTQQPSVEQLAALLFTSPSRGEGEDSNTNNSNSNDSTDSHFLNAHECTPAVLELLSVVCLEAMGRESRDGRDAFVLFAETLLDPPPAPPADQGQYLSDLCALLLNQLHAQGVLRHGDRHERMIAGLTVLVGLVADRASAYDGMSPSGPITSMQTLLRSIVDDTGEVHTFVEKALGRAATTEVVRALFTSLNRLYVVLLIRSVAHGTEALATALQQAADACPTYLLGIANPDETLVLALSHFAIEQGRRAGHSPTVRTALRRLWRQLFSCRQKYLTGLTRRKFDIAYASDSELDAEVESMEALRDQTAKAWSTHTERIASLQTRLAKRPSRRSQRLEPLVFNARLQAASMKERGRLDRRRHKLVDMQRYVLQEWTHFEADLLRERGLWGRDTPEPLDKWALDSLEGPARMRRRLRRNLQFYSDYPYEPQTGPESASSSSGHKRHPTSYDSELWYRQQHLSGGAENQAATSTAGDMPASPCGPLNQDPDTIVLVEGEATEPSPKAEHSRPASRSSMESSGDGSGSGGVGILRRGDTGSSLSTIAEKGEDEPTADDLALLRLLEAGDDLLMCEPSSLVYGLDASEGVFVVAKNNLYFLEGYRIDGTHNLVQHAEATILDKYEPALKWPHREVKDVRPGRYLLQDRALELFSAEGSNTLLAFRDRGRRDAIQDRVCALVRSDGPAPIVPGMDAPKEREPLLLAGLQALPGFGGRTVAQRWENGELSNFQYLMYLNTMAGRSYNDLNQYPVFPWVLANYQSELLDLDDPNTYRDLSKPMGALTPNRAESFELRYQSWEDPLNDGTPAFHYGTHYSSAAIVAGFLVRLEPFTKFFLQLQGGHFDHPDRMFHSIEEAWMSASEKNTNDVKELVPEFFYLPEFLVNSNRFDFGKKQSGEALNDVVLPAWACGDPHEFVRKHRQALESDYVSSHLHEWIDLIFGYKQQGEEAIKALNVFHHLTYEGAVNIDDIKDPVSRRATISIINNFGQTPKQLFKKPHPPRRVLNRPQQMTLSYDNKLERLVCAVVPIFESPAPIGAIAMQGERLVVATKDQVLLGNRLLEYFPPANALLELSDVGGAVLATHENMHAGALTCALAPTPRVLVTGGADNRVRVWSLTPPTGKGPHDVVLRHTLHGHVARVSCLAACPAYNLLASGSDDCTCIIWDLARHKYVRQLNALPSAVTAIAFNQLTGDIVVCSADAIVVYTINGTMRASVRRGISSAIVSCTISELCEWASDNIIATGHRDGRVRLWTMVFDNSTDGWRLSIQPVHTLVLPPDAAGDSPGVTALSVSPDQRRLFSGDMRGRVFAWALPDTSGRSNEHWVKDSVALACMGPNCNVKFSFSERRHHCRNCGKVFCQACSSRESEIPSLHINKLVRVCDACFERLLGSSSLV